MNKHAARVLAVTGAAGVAVATATTAIAATSSSSQAGSTPHVISRHLTPSSPQLAACMPHAKVTVSVDLQTNRVGFDTFRINASGLPRNRDFTVFLLEQAATPFGAAEYIGDFTTNRYGRAHNEFRLIVQEAFSSTLVGDMRVRKDLNRIGAWFADPKGDDFCLGKNSPVTPFDGDNEAGVQAFNSANAAPLPAP